MKDRGVGEMVYRPGSTLTAGPLSAAAQRIMAALRAQYAARIDRKAHMEDSFGRTSSLSQNQSVFNRTPEPPTHNKTLYVSSSYHREFTVNLPQSDLVEKHGYNTKPQQERERQLFLHSPEMELPSQHDLQLLHDGDNRFNQWGADTRGDWKPTDYGDDGSLSEFNRGNNIRGPSRTLPKPDPQGEQLFTRNHFINRGNPQAVVGLPEKCSEIFSRKEGIQLLASSKDEVITYTPPVKRLRVDHLQFPIIIYSNQFEENNSGQKREGGKTHDTPEKMQFCSFEEKLEITKEKEDGQNSEGEIKEFEFKSVLFGADVKESDNVCANGQNEIEECLRSPEDQSYLKDIPLFHKENQKMFFFLADSYDLAANITLTNERHLPVHHTSVSVRTSDFNQYTEDKEQASASEAKSAKVEHVSHRAEVYMHQSGMNDDQRETQESGMKDDQRETQESSIKAEHSEAPKVTETRYDQPAFSQVGQSSGVVCVTLPSKQYGKWQSPQSSQRTPQITLQQEPCFDQTPSISGDTELQHIHQAQQNKGTMPFICPMKSTQNQKAVPVQTATPLKQCKKPTESKVEINSDILKAAWQRCSASVADEKMHLESDRDVDKGLENTKQALALTSHPRVCDASSLSQGERICMLEEAARARALVVTMVYQDGTTQLDPEQKYSRAVCGILVMMKKSLDALVPEDAGAVEERLLFLRLEQKPVWAQQDPQHTQDLFTREILVKMVCGTQSLVCYKSKDLLRTALRYFSKHLSWKQVANCQVLDPQIAAWLLDPADSASCFQNLYNKYCTRATSHTPAQAELRYKKANHVISSLSHLHRMMVELRNKLETQGLWQLYFCMEQKTIPILAAMESHRIHVDRDALKRTSEMLGNKIKHLEQEAHQTAGQKFLVSSSSQLRLVLFEKLRLHERCENKKLPKTVLKQQQSTSEAVLLQLQDLHPLPKIILEYRQVHKIKSTFLDGILSCMTKSFISSTWNQTSTVSGRLSAKHPNFQALPRQPVQISKKQRGEGKEAELVTVHPRAMFIPREGWTFLSADFCQVELRLLAHLSSDPELLRIFQNPETDVFNMLASQWKGVSEDRVSAQDREHVKRIVYSVVYGAGKERLSGILGVSAEEASHFQDSFLQKYKGVQAFIQSTVQHCHKYGYVKSIMGRRRSLPHIHSTDWGVRNQAERQAVNFVVQGSAADLCKMAMIHICSLVASSSTLSARLVAQIHDELLFEVEDTQVEGFAELVKNTMESLQHISCLGVSLTVPLKVSVSTGRSWGSMCEVGLPHAATTHQSFSELKSISMETGLPQLPVLVPHMLYPGATVEA